MLAFEKSADDYFFGFTLFSMICFMIEICLASWAVDNYYQSFFFWLDLVSTITMIPDCGWIWDAILSGGKSGGS